MISSSEKSMDALIPVLNTRNFLEQFDVFKGSILAKSGKEFKSFTTGLPYEWEQYKKPYFPDLGLDLLIKLGEAPGASVFNSVNRTRTHNRRNTD